MDIKSILSNIFQFAKNNQFKVKLDDKLDLEPIREAIADRQSSDDLIKALLVTQNAMMVKDRVEEADKKIEITNKSFEKARKEINFTREEIEKLDAKVKELNNFKGEKGDSPSLQELREIIEPLILPPIKGDPGKDYVLTAKDKKEIAKSIKVPIVEKTVETIIEKQPIVTNEIKEVAVTESSEKIKEKLESLEGDGRLDAKAIKNLPKPSFGGGIKRIDGALDTRIISPANGQTLVWNSTRQVWENSSAGGSGTPAGSDTQVQFNDGGSFGGDAGLTYNKTTNALTVGDVLVDDEAYNAANWNGSLEVPTKNAVRDKIEALDHGALAGLTDDDHTQYALLAGRSGGQTIIGGSGVTDVLSLQGTSGNGTAGNASINLKVGNNGGTTALTILNSGNVGINSASPSSLLTLASTASLESAVLGSELASSNWTTTGWTGSFAAGFTHTTGNTTSLTNTLAAVTNNLYQISYTVTGRTAGSFTINFGGVSNSGLTATGAWGPKAISTGTFSIAPTTDFNGTIVVSVKQITGTYSPTYAILNSAGSASFEIRSTTDGLNNTFIGVGSGRYNTTGSYNSAQGVNALYFNTTGNNNSAQGYQSLYFNTTGSYNSAQGYSALYSNTTGSYNSAQGLNALFSNTTGSNNSAQGLNALYFNTTGSNNSAQGYQAGRYISGGSVANATSNNSLYLGANTMALADGDTNEIVIGYNATGLGSNTAVLGNDSIVTTVLKGKVGVGTTSPTAVLHLKAGTASASTAPLKFTAGTVNTTPEAGTIEFDGTDFFLTI